jgi:hypothetical protein
MANPQVKLLVNKIRVSLSTNGILKSSCPFGPPKVLLRSTAKVANRLANSTQSVIRYTQKPNVVFDALSAIISGVRLIIS